MLVIVDYEPKHEGKYIKNGTPASISTPVKVNYKINKIVVALPYPRARQALFITISM